MGEEQIKHQRSVFAIAHAQMTIRMGRSLATSLFYRHRQFRIVPDMRIYERNTSLGRVSTLPWVSMEPLMPLPFLLSDCRIDLAIYEQLSLPWDAAMGWDLRHLS